MQRPESATHGLVAAAGLVAFLLAVAAIRLYRPFGDDLVPSALLIMCIPAGTIFLLDLAWRKVHRRTSTGLDFTHDDPSWSRTFTKLIGFLGTLGFVGFCYWLFPEYHSPFYRGYFRMLAILIPPWLVMAVPYFHWVDRKMRQPCDGYWHMGKAAKGQWSAVNKKIVGQHLLGWTVKGFFLPLMFTYTCGGLDRLLTYDLGTLTRFAAQFDFLFFFFYLIDDGLVSMGYLMSLRLTDTHIRSTEPTLPGWAVALLCYEPFWSLMVPRYLAYDTGHPWSVWLWNQPFLYMLWGGAILATTAVYVWATVMFGARFSNLTHRGIITNGPYRFTKHPAYVAKNMSWWLISAPFMARMTPDETIRHCLLLVGVNLVYFLRAKTEELHLSADPDYVTYARWVDTFGVFRILTRRAS